MSHVTNSMALSPYNSPQSAYNRSRSSSCSSPIRNRIVFQEIFSVGANTLVRSYSCDQVFDKDSSGQTFQTTQIQISSFITPEKKFGMSDVEIRSKAARKLDVNSSGDAPIQKSTDDGNSKKSSDAKKNIMGRMIKYSLVPVLTACLFYLYVTYRECTYVWDLEKTENELRENVFGQTEALSKINSVLHMCNSSNDVFTLIFTGGVGVGKTFSSSIISHNFPWTWNRLITFSESFTLDVEKLLKRDLSTCGCNLLIVDDLSADISSEAVNLVKLLNSKRKRNEKLLIILIFQVHTETETNAIIDDFMNSFINFYHVPFLQLSKDVVERCYYSEIQRLGVDISDIEFNRLVSDKMEHVDIVKGPTGCKGVAEEVSYYSKNHKDL